MSSINVSRVGRLDMTGKAGDTFMPFPISFTIAGSPESFVGATLKMQIRLNDAVKFTLTETSGITVTGNSLQLLISAADMTANLPANTYQYDIQKTVGSTVATILEGDFLITSEITT